MRSERRALLQERLLREEGRSADGVSHTHAIRFGVFGEAAGPLATDAAQAASRKNYAALILVCIGGIPYFLASLSFTLPREQRLLAARHARVEALRPNHQRNKDLRIGSAEAQCRRRVGKTANGPR
jgi:hypothetical protein